ncbi:MAG: cofactor-independent phosphoglycerate mutase [Deltaproteobacteria bacterium]|jgi:2,3-bisphosphoglycerate-independent phosphoglycerate mutase|nr:cofactor-independent phosphoglycerate mutase [Deltaproteobacteria bacterium]
MKYVILIGDGMGDYPLESLGGRSPLEYATTANLDRLAKEGMLARCATIPEGMAPGSDVAIFSLMAYCAKGVLEGRGPLEAAALKIPLKEGDLAFRMNLVTVGHDGADTIMLNHASGDISNPEAGELISALKENMPLAGQKIYQGVSYRHILIWPGAPLGLPSIPPHDHLDEKITNLINEPKNAPIMDLVKASWPILENHPVNKKRVQAGLPPANSIWLWGQGRTPIVKSYKERWGITGATVSAVDIIRGLAITTGLVPLTVPGATGTLDTNYEGKVEAALAALKSYDLVIVHLEAPDECSHQGDLKSKIKAIENFDARIVGPILKALPSFGDYRILCSCDHYTPVMKKTHSSDPVPFVLYDSQNPAQSGGQGYSEKEAAKNPTIIPDGPSLGLLFFGPERQ